MDDPLHTDWYSFLGCERDATNTAIEKAARKLALKYHPDKSTDPNATENFLLVSKAKEILLDDVKRKKLDENLRLEAKRKATEAENEKRKKMKDALDLKIKPDLMKASQTAKEQTSNFENRKVPFKTDILGKSDSSTKKEVLTEEQRKQEEKRKQDFLKYVNGMVNESKIQRSLQVKLKWKRSRHSHTRDSLKKLLSDFGEIENVDISIDKGNAAVVTFKDANVAKSVVKAFEGSEDYRATYSGDVKSRKKTTAAIGDDDDDSNSSDDGDGSSSKWGSVSQVNSKKR